MQFITYDHDTHVYKAKNCHKGQPVNIKAVVADKIVFVPVFHVFFIQPSVTAPDYEILNLKKLAIRTQICSLSTIQI